MKRFITGHIRVIVQVTLLCVVGLTTFSVIAARGPDGTSDCGPKTYPWPWNCSQVGYVDNPGTLDPVAVTTCVGSSVTPSVTGTTFVKGRKWITYSDNCGLGTEGADISYDAKFILIDADGNESEDSVGPLNQPGIYPYDVWVYGKSTDSDCNEDTDYAFVGTLTVTVVQADVKSLEFLTDHGILLKNETDWTKNGALYPTPEWTKGGNNSPISQTKNTSVQIKLKISVQPADLVYDLHGEGGEGLTFVATGVTSTGGEQELTITASSPLPNKITKIEKNITWTVSTGGATCDAGQSGKHKVFVTWDMPFSGAVGEQPDASGLLYPSGGNGDFGPAITYKRLDWAVGIAKDATSVSTAAVLFRDAVGRELGEGADIIISIRHDPWRLLAGGLTFENYDCSSLVGVAVEGLHTVGIPADFRVAYPTVDGTDFYTPPHPVTPDTCKFPARFQFDRLGIVDRIALYYPENQYEAFFTVNDPNTKGYTVWPKDGPFESRYYYLEALRAGDPSLKEYWGWYQCFDENFNPRVDGDPLPESIFPKSKWHDLKVPEVPSSP